ncbi:MAG: hypothetical protein QXY50_02840 [Candidatus Caldarchaeum sp.]
MEWREYFKFVLVGALSLIVGGIINQALGLTGQSSIVAVALVFVIPLTIFYILWRRLK